LLGSPERAPAVAGPADFVIKTEADRGVRRPVNQISFKRLTTAWRAQRGSPRVRGSGRRT
jgi:hypothetical protein